MRRSYPRGYANKAGAGWEGIRSFIGRLRAEAPTRIGINPAILEGPNVLSISDEILRALSDICFRPFALPRNCRSVGIAAVFITVFFPGSTSRRHAIAFFDEGAILDTLVYGALQKNLITDLMY